MNVQHERNHVLRERLRVDGLLTAPVAAELELPWRVNGLLLHAVFFVLTAIALAAFVALLDALGVPGKGIAGGVAALGVAEYLINVRRWSFTGVEAALWLGGTIAFISELPPSGTPESNLVIAAACAIAGARTRHPLIGAAAAVFIAVWAEERYDLGVAAALLIAVMAMFALLRTWRRPTNEWLFIALVLVMPLAGRAFADEMWRTTTIILYCGFAALALALGPLRRHHAFFLAALSGAAIAGAEVAILLGDVVAAEVKLAAGGALLLAIAFGVTRALRDRTRGFVLTPSRLTPLDEDLQLAATFALKPETPEITTRESGGGAFGGAGASGGWESSNR